MRSFFLVLAVFIALFSRLPAPASADVPRTVPFQGALTGPTGLRKPDGTYVVTFRLYDAATAGNLLWTESGKTVTVSRGLFSTRLGDTTPFGALPFDAPYFLEVQVAGEAAAMTPRLPLQSVPYALTAANVPAGSITADKIAPGVITADKLVPSLQQTLAGFTSAPALFADPAYNWLYGSSAYGVDIAVDGSTACVLVSDNSLWVFDLSNPDAPYEEGIIPTDASPRHIVMAGGYVYALNANNTIRVYDVRSYTSLSAGTLITAPVATAADIAVGNGRLYVVGDDSLVVYSLANPAVPTVAGRLDYTRPLKKVAAHGSLAYVFTGAPAPYQMLVCSVANPASPMVVGSVNSYGEVTTATAAGNQVYFNYYGGYVLTYDVTDPTKPVYVTYSFNQSGAVHLGSDGAHAFVVSTASSTLQVVQPDPTSYVSVLGSTGTQNSPIAVAGANGSVYVTSANGYLIQPFSYKNAAQAPTNFSVKGGLSIVGTHPYPLVVSTQPGGYGISQTDGNVLLSTFVDARGGWLGTVSNHNLNLYTYDSSPQVTLNTSGNLGVGTQTPEGKLNVVGGSRWTVNGWTKSLTLENASAAELGHATGGIRFGLGATSNILCLFTSDGEDANASCNYRLAMDGATGNLGLGGTLTPQYTLDVAGTVRGTFVSASDARFKTNVQELPNALDAILNLRGVSFDWRTSQFPYMHFPQGRQLGFIAQEVERSLPELVSTDRDGYKAVNYQGLVPVLVEGMKDQQRQIGEKDARISALERQNAAIEERLERLEKAAASLRPKFRRVAQGHLN